VGASVPRTASASPSRAGGERAILGLDPGFPPDRFWRHRMPRSRLQARSHGCIAVAGLSSRSGLRRIFEALSALIRNMVRGDAVERVFVTAMWIAH